MHRHVPMRATVGGLLTAAFLVGALDAGRSHAAPPIATADPPSIQVHYADLDPSTDQGAHILLQRITAAAHRVCPSAEGDLDAFAASRRCRRQAIARAVRNVGSSRLATLFGKQARRDEPRRG